MDDINDLVIILDLRPLLNVERIELQLVRSFQHEDDLEQIAGCGCAPNEQLVIALLFRPWRSCMADDILGKPLTPHTPPQNQISYQLEDLRELTREAHRRGIYVILENP